jgi:hypothetical protein
VDSNWYADSDVTDHVTGELDKLAMKDNYTGGDQIYTASGSGMHIKYVGHAIIRTSYRDLKLNHILHVPQLSKNLASIHKITSDNNVFFELHPDFFFIKDGESRKTLHVAPLLPRMINILLVLLSHIKQGGMLG